MPKYRRGSGNVFARGKNKRLWIGYYKDGQRFREPAIDEDGRQIKDPASARRLLRKKLDEIANGTFVGPKADRVTFEDLVAGLFTDYEMNGRRSLRSVKIRVNKHLTPFFGGRRAHSVTAADLTQFVSKRQTEGASNAEINREMAALKRMFNLALDGGAITRKPRFQKKLPENNVRKGFFEYSQVNALLASLPDYLRGPISFAFLTGWRIRSEVLTLTWSLVNFDEETIRLPKGATKNGEPRVLYLEGEVKALVEQQWNDHQNFHLGCAFVFHRNGSAIKDFRGVWDRACTDAKLSGRIPHDFRRTAVRNMTRNGIPERVAMKISGHLTRDVFDRYNIVDEADLRSAASKLGDSFRRVNGHKFGHKRGSKSNRSLLTH